MLKTSECSRGMMDVSQKCEREPGHGGPLHHCTDLSFIRSEMEGPARPPGAEEQPVLTSVFKGPPPTPARPSATVLRMSSRRSRVEEERPVRRPLQ